MRSVCLVRAFLAGAAVALTSGMAVAMGPLDPPAGPPSSTMKRLDQIESRRVLNDCPSSADAVCVISASGRYYLTGDLLAQPNKHAVLVTAEDVEIDLNGFSIRAVQGALDGVHCVGGGGGGGSGGSFRLVGHGGSITRCEGCGNPWLGSCVVVEDRTSSTIEGLTVEYAGGNGFKFLHCENVIHRDIAARYCQLGGVVITGPDTSSSAARGPRQTVSLDGCRVSDCGGHGVCVVTCPSGSCDISCVQVRARDCFGNGICVERGGGGGGAGGALRCSVTFNECFCTDMGGWGVSVASAVASSSDQFAQVRGFKVEIARCAGGGVRFEDCDDLNCDGMSVSDCTGDGVHCAHIGPSKWKNIVLKRCTGSGFSAADCQSGSCSDCDISECGGAGMSVATCAAWLLLGQRISACGSFGVEISDCGQFSCAESSISSCTGVGLSVARAVKCECTHLRVSQGQSHGVKFEDCDDLNCDRVLLSNCAGTGMLSVWGSTHASPRLSVHHQLKGVTVRGCTGDGISVVCPPGASSVDMDMDGCACTSNGGHGVVVTGSSPECNMHLNSSQPKIIDNQKGLLISFSSVAPVNVHLAGADISSNRDDGLSVVSNNPAVTLRGGGSVRCSSCTFTRNGGTGCLSENPLYMDRCDVGENVLYGARCIAPDSLTLACVTTDCVFQRNGAACMRCGPGRYSDSGGQFSDGFAEGVVVDSGCCLLTHSTITRCALDGVSVHGTLTVEGGASRRNGQSGYRCADGSCVAKDCLAELNGTAGGAGGGTVIIFGGMEFTDCSSVTLQRCVSSNNFGDGFKCTSSVGPIKWMAPECISSRNAGHGFDLSDCSGSLLDRCTATGNGGQGLRATATFSDGTIRDFVSTGNGGGMQVAGTGNMITRCSSTSGTLGGISIAPNNAVGATVDGAVLPQRCNPNDNVLH